MQENINIDKKGNVTGVLKYINGFTGYDENVANQYGYYLALNVNEDGDNLKVDEYVDGEFTKTILEQSNENVTVCFKVASKDSAYSIKVDGKEVSKLSFAKATFKSTLAPAPTITLANTNWVNVRQRVTVNIPTGLGTATAQRQISFNNGGTWANWALSTFAEQNGVLLAKYYFKQDVELGGVQYHVNDESDIVAYEVTNLDFDLPQIEIETSGSGDLNVNSDSFQAEQVAKVIVTTTDKTSGVETFKYSKVSVEQDIQGNSIELTQSGSYDFTATDKASNEATRQVTIS